jgi:hypothetical protein
LAEAVGVTLTKLKLWVDVTRFQTWPALLANIPPGTEFSSPRKFGQFFVTERLTDVRHLASEDVIRNLPGLEGQGGRLILKGLGLLERNERMYRVSRVGAQLAELYQADRTHIEWVRLLARLLLSREPRTRVLMRLLSEPGAFLRFTADKWFGGKVQRAEINIPGRKPIAPFASEDQEIPCLREFLQEQAWWALGSWRADNLLAGADNCRFVGQMQESFSLHQVGSALRASCEVFHYLGILQSEGGECHLDCQTAISQLGDELATDFGWSIQPQRAKPFLELLAEQIEALRSDTGYVVASELRSGLNAKGVKDPDREIADQELAGYLVIDAASYGQSRHGEGLYRDPRKQLIKIRILGGH